MYDLIRITFEKKKKIEKNKERIVYIYKYYDSNGNEIVDLNKNTKKLISELSIPPGYDIVYIYFNKKSYYSYIGVDKNGKKQYKYSEYQNIIRKKKKYCQLINFGLALENIRLSYTNILKLANFKNINEEKELFLFLILILIDKCNFRIGSNRDKKNKGLLDIKNENIKLINNKININFIGKDKKINICERNEKIIIDFFINRGMIIENSDIFSYYNKNGKLEKIKPKAINLFLKKFGKDITSKNFRTWAANKYFIEELIKLDYTKSLSLLEKKKNINNILKIVSSKIFNSPKVCKDEYIIPDIIDIYLKDELEILLMKCMKKTEFSSFSQSENILLNVLTNLKENYCI